MTVQPVGRGEIGFVVAARMTDGARHVVVLDAVPPFVKVFDRQGHLRAAFARKGAGPGEVEAPSALAASGDTAILVADARGGLSVFDLDGRLKWRSRPLGIVPLALAPGCGGGWTLYGPAVTRARSPAWLHDLQPSGDSAVLRGTLQDSLPAEGVGIGLAYGLVRGPAGLVLRHDAGHAVYARGCGALAPSLLFQTPARGSRGEIRSGEGRQVTHAPPGTRAVAGIAEVAGGWVLADVFAGGGTELVLHRRGGATRTRRVRGEWFLRDSGPGGVLVSTDDPDPRLYVLRPAAFERLFARR
ncbi:MAG TPA: hypothetical protein VJT67_07630 [Longimicrobiaceae bacterium]|nr:hypothetical protein [Longimicrobiaceae bacterium]